MADDPPPNVMVEGRDYRLDAAGRWVFTRSYLLGRGRCCGSKCRNCPYYPAAPPEPIDAPTDRE